MLLCVTSSISIPKRKHLPKHPPDPTPDPPSSRSHSRPSALQMPRKLAGNSKDFYETSASIRSLLTLDWEFARQVPYGCRTTPTSEWVHRLYAHLPAYHIARPARDVIGVSSAAVSLLCFCSVSAAVSRCIAAGCIMYHMSHATCHVACILCHGRCSMVDGLSPCFCCP